MWQWLETTLSIWIKIWQGKNPCPKGHCSVNLISHLPSQMALGELTLPKTYPYGQEPGLDFLQWLSHALGREEGSVVGWQHNMHCWKLCGQEVGVLKLSLQSQHWLIGFSVHSLSELKALNPLQRPPDNITSLPGQGAHSWVQHCGHRSQFCLQTLHWKPLWVWPKLNSVHKLLGVAYSIFSLQFIGKLILIHSHYIMKCNVEIFHEGYLNRVWKPDEQ